MSEIESIQKEIDHIKDSIRELETRLLNMSFDQPEYSPLEHVSDLPENVLTIDSIINLIHIRNFERLKYFKLIAKIEMIYAREKSKYGKVKPQIILISNGKEKQFKLLNWHISLDEKLQSYPGKWALFEFVYIKENNKQFFDPQIVVFKIGSNEVQFNIHSSSKKFIVKIYSEKYGVENKND